jgi:hypothetical protein
MNSVRPLKCSSQSRSKSSISLESISCYQIDGGFNNNLPASWRCKSCRNRLNSDIASKDPKGYCNVGAKLTTRKNARYHRDRIVDILHEG